MQLRTLSGEGGSVQKRGAILKATATESSSKAVEQNVLHDVAATCTKGSLNSASCAGPDRTTATSQTLNSASPGTCEEGNATSSEPVAKHSRTAAGAVASGDVVSSFSDARGSSKVGGSDQDSSSHSSQSWGPQQGATSQSRAGSQLGASSVDTKECHVSSLVASSPISHCFPLDMTQPRRSDVHLSEAPITCSDGITNASPKLGFFPRPVNSGIMDIPHASIPSDFYLPEEGFRQLKLQKLQQRANQHSKVALASRKRKQRPSLISTSMGVGEIGRVAESCESDVEVSECSASPATPKEPSIDSVELSCSNNPSPMKLTQPGDSPNPPNPQEPPLPQSVQLVENPPGAPPSLPEAASPTSPDVGVGWSSPARGGHCTPKGGTSSLGSEQPTANATCSPHHHHHHRHQHECHASCQMTMEVDEEGGGGGGGGGVGGGGSDEMIKVTTTTAQCGCHVHEVCYFSLINHVF